MLLALDAGNSNITIGAFEDRSLIGHWRLRTVLRQTADEWGILLRNLFSLSGLDLAKVQGIIISSVVPPLDSSLAEMAEKYFHMQAMFVTPATDTGIQISYENPSEVGADRIVDSVAAFAKYGGPCVIVDLGTAITFDVRLGVRLLARRPDFARGSASRSRPSSPKTARFADGGVPRAAEVDRHEPRWVAFSRACTTAPIGMIDGILERLIAELARGRGWSPPAARRT